MTYITDETLMAYADGELDGPRANAVRAALRGDRKLRARLDEMQSMNELIRAAFTPELEVPDRFANLLSPGAEGKVVSLPERLRQRARRWVPAGAAIAAGVAGLMAGNLMTSGSTAMPDHIGNGLAIVGAMQTVASHTPSGQTLEADGLSITPVVSFMTNDAGFCRELHVSDKQMAARVVACKNKGENGWSVEALARTPKEAPSAYRTAGARSDPVIDAAFTRRGAKEMLDAKAESEAIARAWSGR
jgi:hypothetical protein